MEILEKGVGEKFYSFANADGKTWLMPVCNMRTAMNLYQPSGWKGLLLKALFPLLHFLPPVRQVLKAEAVRCGLREDLRRLLCRLFSAENIELAVFYGTPSVHQKITIQLHAGKKILGYCKVTDKEDIARLFLQEEEVLSYLGEQGVKDIPRCLYAGEWTDGMSLFVQSTAKTNASRVLHCWGELHDDFLRQLTDKTRQRIQFEDTDFHGMLQQLRGNIGFLPDEQSKAMVADVVEHVLTQNSGKMVEYSAYHADFTPWNMFYEGGRLFVFDWEYAKLTYPPLLDRYHYYIQTAIFEQHKNASEIMEQLKAESWMTDECLQYYLLDIVARFAMREEGKYSGDVAKSMSIWLELLARISQSKK